LGIGLPKDNAVHSSSKPAQNFLIACSSVAFRQRGIALEAGARAFQHFFACAEYWTFPTEPFFIAVPLPRSARDVACTGAGEEDRHWVDACAQLFVVELAPVERRQLPT
jgi:hypothetical protein